MVSRTEIKEHLLERQAELQGRLNVTQAAERREVGEGLDDNAQLWEVSEIRDGLEDEAAGELSQVNQALARLDAGEYGLCQSCGDPIGEARLQALPYATLCIGCAEEAEK